LSNSASDNFGPMKDSQKVPPCIENYASDNDFNIPKPNKLRLLVLDQNAQVRKACCEIAENLKLIVTEAESPVVAREILKKNSTAILLLDVTDPKGDNRVLLKEMKALCPDTPVIAMSAKASIADVVEIMRIGASDYLSKPFPLNVLTEALKRASGRWHFGVERRHLQETLSPQAKMVDALGQSQEMEKLYRTLPWQSYHVLYCAGIRVSNAY